MNGCGSHDLLARRNGFTASAMRAAERRRMRGCRGEASSRRTQGQVSLLDLFEGRRQLIVYRAFFDPALGWPDMPAAAAPGSRQVSTSHI